MDKSQLLPTFEPTWHLRKPLPKGYKTDFSQPRPVEEIYGTSEYFFLRTIVTNFDESEAYQLKHKCGLSALKWDIKPEYFGSQEAKLFWDVILIMRDKNLTIDLTTFLEIVKKKVILVGADLQKALVAVGELMTPTAQNTDYHAQRMIEEYCHREIALAASDRTPDAGERIGKMQVILEKLKGSLSSNADIIDVTEAMDLLIQKMDDRTEKQPEYLSLKYKRHDSYLRILPGHLVVVGGRSGSGKTSYSTNVIKNLCLSGKKVGFFSMEMTSSEVLSNMLAMTAMVEHHKIMDVDLTDDDYDNIHYAAQKFYKSKLKIVDSPRQTCSSILRTAQQIKNQMNGLDAIFIDHMHVMGDDRKFDSVREKIMFISGELKNMAKEINVPIFALAQMNRDADKRTGEARKPQVSDLKESGSIEQDADVILFTYRPNYYDANCGDNNTYICCRKNRHGDNGNFEIPMSVNPKTRVFSELFEGV